MLVYLLKILSILGLCATFCNAPGREPDAGLIEVYEHDASFTLSSPPPDAIPIVLQVPEDFRSPASRGMIRDWGLNILTFYPSLTSPKAPENAPFRSCTGDCNGRMMISIVNRFSSIHNPIETRGRDHPNMGDYIAHVRINDPMVPRGATKMDLGPQYGFDGGYQVYLPAGKVQSDQVTQYFFHLSDDHIHYDLAAQCSLNQWAKVCTLHFSLSCHPGIYVQVVALDMKHIEKWKDVVARTDAFVTAMVRSPACK